MTLYDYLSCLMIVIFLILSPVVWQLADYFRVKTDKIWIDNAFKREELYHKHPFLENRFHIRKRLNFSKNLEKIYGIKEKYND